MPGKKFSVIVLLLLAFCLHIAPVQGQSIDTLEFTLGTVSGNPGDTVELPVYMNAGNTSPSTFILWIRYDPALLTPDENYYQFTQFVPDGSGVPEVSTSFVRPESSVVNGDKFVETNISQPGLLVALVAGGPEQTVSDGLVLTLAFTISNSAIVGENFSIEGVDEDDDTPNVSSAADSSDFPQNIPVQIREGLIVVGCSPAADVVGVAATSNRSDGVLITWTANAETTGQYRVYRNSVNDSATAQPIGGAWQAATSFLDITAAAPTINDEGGCNKPADFTVTAYFYWVVARTAEGCVSESFSTPSVQGSRTLEGTKKIGDFVAENVLPAGRASASAMSADPESVLALRLDAGEVAIDPTTVWGVAIGEGWKSDAISLSPANEQGALWVSLNSDTVWIPGEHITFEVGAHSANGTLVGPIVAEYIVSGGKSTQVVPLLPEGIGEVFEISFESDFESPETFLLPIPEANVDDDLYLYYYAQGVGWTLAENVDGFFVDAKSTGSKVKQNVAVTLRHSGVVQLGLAPFPAPHKQQNASILGGAKNITDMFLFLLVLTILAGLSKRRGSILST